VRIADPSLAGMPVSGSFVAGDSKAAVAAFAALLPIRIADLFSSERSRAVRLA